MYSRVMNRATTVGEATRISRFTSAPDGLRLHYFEYGASDVSAAPVVCLPGLARTADDFDRLASVLASKSRRRVLALDYRGRGASAWDADWTHYNTQVEHTDILAVLALAGVTNAVFIGTSRGGIHVMLLAAMQPSLLRAAVINVCGNLNAIARHYSEWKCSVGAQPALHRVKNHVAIG